MYCSRCGTAIADGVAFCNACGQPTGPTAPAQAQAAVLPPPPLQPQVVAGAPVLYAGFWLRFVAFIIDLIILGCVGGILGGVIFGIMGISMGGLLRPDSMGGLRHPEMMAPAILGAVALVELALFVGQWLYFALLESSTWQATLGKKALGLYVTDIYGARIGFGRATGRYFAKFISGLTLSIGYIMAGFTEKKQALHDMIASCLVLRKA